MQKHLALVLTSEPEHGGKFQYSVSLLEALGALNRETFRLSVVYFDSAWEKYFSTADNIALYKCEINILARAIRKAVLQLPFGLDLWRKIGSTFHPLFILLNKLKPDLVFYPGNDPYVYESQLPGVIPIFDLMHRYEKRFPEVSQNGIYESRERHYKNICKHAAGILTDSDIGKRHVIESYSVDPSKIFVLPYIPPKIIDNKDVNVKDKYNLPPKFLFYPAQFWEHKNHVRLLRAMAKLKDGVDDIKMVFVGSRKNGFQDVARTINELGLKNDVFILGYVSDEDLVSLYRFSVGLVMPTFFGPTNIPPLEAFALGCPVAVSNIYAMPDQVGDAALLFDPKDVDDIAEKTALLWRDEQTRKRLAEKGFAKSLEWNQAAFNRKLADIVDQLILSA